MEQVGDGWVGAAGGQATGAAAQPMTGNQLAVTVQVNGVAPGVGALMNTVGNAAPAAALVGPAPVAPGAAMLAVPVIPNLVVPPGGAEPRFDVEAVLLGPLPTRINFAGFEIHPWVDEDEP